MRVGYFVICALTTFSTLIGCVAETQVQDGQQNSTGVDPRVPQVTPIDQELRFVSQDIRYRGQSLPRPSVSHFTGAMTVRGFPGVDGEVHRFQVTEGCAPNNWDCRPENRSSFTRRNEVSLPRNKSSASARVGDTTSVEYSVYIASNPSFSNLAIYDDFYHFGQFHGSGDEDVPYMLGITPSQYFPAPSGTSVARHGDLAFFIRSTIFPDILEDHGARYAIMLARRGDFEDRWHRVRFEITWAEDRTGSAAFYFNNRQVFLCESCVTAPIHDMTAIMDGRRVPQGFYFKYGIYNWRRGSSRATAEPPTVVAYYRDLSWSNHRN